MAHQESKSLERARELRRHDTPAERKLWEALRARRLGGSKFVRQLPIGPYFADFACRDRKLVIEVDGVSHGSDAEVQYDARRTGYLIEQGYRVLRFWNDDVHNGLADVCDAILLELGEWK